METTTLGGYGQMMAVNYPVGLRLIPADKLVMVPPAAMGGNWSIAGYDMQLEAGTVCTDLKFKPKQCSFSESYTRTNDGGLITSAIETRLIKPDGLMMAWLMTAAQIRWVAVVPLQTEEVLVVGTPELPLLLTWGRASGNHNDVRISLSGQAWHPALAMTRADFETLGEAEFTIEFDLSFNA
ncbi:hypothetical protein DR864_27280 [Runella rosea]|uniref:Uncharacterized protein n=1 Tax=Runella rosea TaxID=2259595 RepID=A0A344TRA5_9BACT|nr:hypothetical protein [Runella rosea]AXE21176.1 hypothetical protein DR864_27280 [Runella rosea]